MTISRRSLFRLAAASLFGAALPDLPVKTVRLAPVPTEIDSAPGPVTWSFRVSVPTNARFIAAACLSSNAGESRCGAISGVKFSTVTDGDDLILAVTSPDGRKAHHFAASLRRMMFTGNMRNAPTMFCWTQWNLGLHEKSRLTPSSVGRTKGFEKPGKRDPRRASGSRNQVPGFAFQ